MRKSLIIIVGFMTVLTILFGIYSNGHEVVYETIEVVREVTPVPDVMRRIAKCESDDRQFGQSGQVLMMANTNGTVDVGRYQINTVHFASATAMGLDLTKEADNEAFAMHLYKTQGTEPWVYSKKCWR